MQFTTARAGTFAVLALLTLVAPEGVGRVQAQELADLKVDSKARKYSEKNPLQAAKQEFGLSKAGMVKMVYKTDMVYKDSRGGFSLDEVDLRNYTVGRGIFQKRTPDTAIPGQPYTFEQHWLCENREKPLNLRASLVAPHYHQSGDQLAANQVLTITFVPFDKISAEPGPAPQVDVAGKWYHGEENATLTFTPTAVAGEYEVAEKGYDNIKGTAKVKGRKVFIDWVTTTAKGDKQKKGATIVEIKPDGTHAEGWTVGDHGVGGEKWSAATGTTAKPVKPTGTTPGPASPGKWEYRVLDLPADQAFGDQLQKKLNELGGEGWEVVGLLTPPAPKEGTPSVRLVLKKPKS